MRKAGAGEVVDPGWSDRPGQLGEGSRRPRRRGFFDSAFVVAAAKILDERMPGADHPRAAETCSDRASAVVGTSGDHDLFRSAGERYRAGRYFTELRYGSGW